MAGCASVLSFEVFPMLGIVQPRGTALALVLTGVVFFLIGVTRSRIGGSAAFIPLGIVFVILGYRRARRVVPGPVG